MENPKSLYKKLSDNGLYTKTYEDFVGQYGNAKGQKELYTKLSSNGLYTKSEQEFVGQYWAPEKKNSMESVSTPTPPVTPSVSTETTPVTPSVSPAPIPVEEPITGSQGKLLIPQKPFYEFKVPEQQPQVAAKAPMSQPVAKQEVAVEEPTMISQGKLLIPERKEKFPAVTETVTTYKNVPVTAPSKNTKNVPLNPELMLQAIAKNEGGRIGVKTAIKGKGTNNTASGTYQITEGTLENIYNKDADFKKSYDNFQKFKKDFNSNPEVEHQAALSHMSSLIKQFGIHALTAWYSPDHAARAAAGNESALREVPRRDAGNKMTAGSYFRNAFSNYKNLLGMQPEQQKTARIPVKQEVIKEPAVEVPSLSKYDVTNPNYYNAKGQAYPQVEEISYMEDLWNRLRGSGAKALAGVLSMPALARTYAEDVVYAASGLDKEFNKLPSAAKKEVLNTVRTIQASGDINTAAAIQSQEAFNYLNKKADKIYERTIKQEGDVFTDIANFKDNPSADNALNIVNRGVRSLVESIPYMATAILPGGNITQGIASAGSKRLEDLNKDGNVGLGYMLSSAVHGTAEGFFEAKTNAILKKAGTILRGNTKAVEEFSTGIVKSILKDFNEEGLSEGATTFIQELADKINKEEDINIGQIFRNVANSYFLGGFAGGGITASAGGIRTAINKSIAAKTYVANKIMPTEDRKKYDNNLATIQNLNTQKSEDTSPEVNQVIDNKIQQLATENETLFKSSVQVVDNLSNEQLSQVFNIDDELERNYNDAKSIIDDATMDDSAKELLLKDLLDKQNNLKQQRDAIQEQTTSEVPIQPEAGASLQVAEGEPQAEPQVPTEEVKAEEVVTPPEEVVTEVVKPTEMSNEEWTKVQDLADRISKGEDITAPEDLQMQEDYPKAIESLIAKKEKPAPKEEVKPAEKIVLSDTQNSAIQEAIKKGQDMVKRYPKQDDLILKYKARREFQKKNQEYINADQSQKDEMIRQINYALKLDSKKESPSAKKVLGIKPTMVTVDQMVALKDQLLLEEKAAKGGVDFANKAKKIVNAALRNLKKGALDSKATNALLKALDAKAETPEQRRDIISNVIAIFKKSEGKVAVEEMAALKDQIKLEIKAAKGGAKYADDLRKSIVAQIKSFITRGKMSVANQNALLNGLKSNLLNPKIREKFFTRMEKMFNRIDYADRLLEANTIRKKIRKLAKSDTLQASVAIMAKDFAKLIPDYTDIDDYIEKAKEVFDAIKIPKMKGEELSLREAATIDDINDYTKEALATQEEIVKNNLLDQYDYLVEAGLIDGKMSLKDIQDYVTAVESGEKKTKLNKDEEIRDRVGKLFDSMSGIVNSILENGTNPFTGEQVDLDATTRSIIKRFVGMDLKRLSITQMYRATEALENYLTNDIVDNMETINRLYEGALKADAIEKDGVRAQNLKRFGIFSRFNLIARTWAVNISPIKSILDLMFRSREVGTKMFNAMGLREIANQSSKAKNETKKIDEAYVKRFGKTKPNGKDFNSAENVYERGMYAHLRRSFAGTKEEIKIEFDRRKKQIVNTIAKLNDSGDSKLIKKAQMLEQVFEKIKDAKDIKEVEKSINSINKDAVKWWNSIFDKYYPEVKQVASSVYNTILEDDINYSPDNYEKIIEETDDLDENQKSSYKMSFNFLNAEKSGTLMKNQRLEELPENRVISFDFDSNNSSALAKMLVDIRTAPAVQQYKGFTESSSFNKIFPDTKDRNVIKERMNWYVNEVRHKNIVDANVRAKDAQKILGSISKYGTARALGSFSSFVKQFGTATLNTMINLANNPTAYAKGFAALRNKDAQKFLNDSGYGIANRGLESQTAIESADKILEKTDVNSIDKISTVVGKAGKIYLDNFLKYGDALAARSSWLSYYISKLDKMGENTSNIDWATHKLNKEAADYAEDQVNLQQNVSDADMLGKFLNTKNPYASFAKSMFMPFSSFIFNAKDRISTDLTILTSNSNKTEKLNAVKSLTATAAEMVVFQAIAATASNLIIMAAYSILGYDEDEDEKESRIKKYIQMASTTTITDILSPIPNLGDKVLVAVINKFLNNVQIDEDEEDRVLLYEYDPQGQIDAILGLIGGIPQIAGKPLVDISSTINMLSSEYYVDKFGNEVYLTPEDKDKLKFVLGVELLMATNALPNEVSRINQKVKDTIEKEAR
jgi:hypothetical protein